MEEVIFGLGDSGNLTPPVSVYNTSLASEITTISGLPVGIAAVIANLLLILCIIFNKFTQQPHYTLYLHIALCDLVNGIIGIITASFLLRNKTAPIDPAEGEAFCRWFEPVPTFVIRLLVYLMTILALLRLYIVTRPGARVTRRVLNLWIFLAWALVIVMLFWYKSCTDLEVMVLPDGWCVHLERSSFPTESSPDTPTSTLVYLLLLDAGPVLLCYALTSASLLLVYWRVTQSLSAATSTATSPEDSPETSETQPLIQTTAQHRTKQNPNLRIARSIVNHVLLSFVICYSAAVYNEIKQLISVAQGAGFPYVHFTKEQIPSFDENALFIFRLKFALTTVYSVINPILVFRGSPVFRCTLSDLMAVPDQFSYIISNHRQNQR